MLQKINSELTSGIGGHYSQSNTSVRRLKYFWQKNGDGDGDGEIYPIVPNIPDGYGVPVLFSPSVTAESTITIQRHFLFWGQSSDVNASGAIFFSN